MSNEDVKAAEIKVEAARAKLTASLQEVSRQFAPHRLMEEVWEKAKDKGADLAEDAVDAVRARPYAATGVVAHASRLLVRGRPANDVRSGRAGSPSVRGVSRTVGKVSGCNVTGRRRQSRKTPAVSRAGR